VAKLQHRIDDVLAPVIAYDNDIDIISGEGSWVTDRAGNRYLDFATGIAVSNLGHQHPGVRAAVLEQIDQIWHAGGSFRYESKVQAAERLRDITPDGIEQFFFMNSGAEAVEGAVKLARKTSGRQGIVVFRGGFHGRTMGSVSYTTSKAKYRQGYHPLVGSTFVTPYPHPFAWGKTQEEADDHALFELHEMFKSEITPGEVACFLVEPMQGEGGYYPASPHFMNELRRLSDDHGILLIADEVQSGFGRTGDWFASQVIGVRPDIIVMGKGIANGFPLSAVGASTELLAKWPPGSHGTTYGGNPVCCAACVGTIDGLKTVIPGVPELSAHAFRRLNELKDKHETIGDVRGMGLMIGIGLVEPGTNRPDAEAYLHIKKHALQRGMLILNCGPDLNIIRFIPPLNVSLEDLDLGIDIIDEALASYET
jgi:4-aminobutyrate aminotransferase